MRRFKKFNAALDLKLKSLGLLEVKNHHTVDVCAEGGLKQT